MHIKFEIEEVLFIRSLDRTVVLARQITPSNWILGEDPHLGGVPIRKWTDIPRAQDAHGGQRYDLFGFALRDNAMATKFAVGKLVDLEP